nr:MAG TPA: hypothetical protein [Caudoviricetes sp.]
MYFAGTSPCIPLWFSPLGNTSLISGIYKAKAS